MSKNICPDEPNKINIRELLRSAVEKLSSAGIDTPILDAEVLLSHASGLSRVQMIAHPEYTLNQDIYDLFINWIDRRYNREPLAYITGEREFYGITFKVTPDVLIPRQDTEILVETSLNLIKHISNPAIADIGVGSGAITVSLARYLPNASIYGTDSSDGALQIASDNADRAGVGDRLHLIKGDLLNPLNAMKFDMIVSNPPYIPTAEIDKLEPEVAKYEPRGALDGGPDGLDYYRRLISEAPAYLKSSGILAVEIGIGQSGDVSYMYKTHGFHDVCIKKDYSGIDRVVSGIKG
ncbi:MAG: peptide chain release factor N(5)-glutamine methyltransferase [Armatimonadota bacterium]